jgi:hypothetical protein
MRALSDDVMQLSLKGKLPPVLNSSEVRTPSNLRIFTYFLHGIRFDAMYSG